MFSFTFSALWIRMYNVKTENGKEGLGGAEGEQILDRYRDAVVVEEIFLIFKAV